MTRNHRTARLLPTGTFTFLFADIALRRRAFGAAARVVIGPDRVPMFKHRVATAEFGGPMRDSPSDLSPDL